MRQVVDMQMKLGEIAIADIQFDPNSRDEIPKLLRGLQSIYCDTKIRERVFAVLKEMIPENVNPNNGRRGMDLWKIFVLGTLRLNCNWDYDKVLEIANNHARLRQMLCHGLTDADYRYTLQTLKDNISLFTPEVLDKVNRIVINYGHKIVGKKAEAALKGSCDTYVVETDVHHPTDINLLFDALRKTIILTMRACDEMGIWDWRQGAHHLRKAKRFFRKAQQMKNSSSKDEVKRLERKQLIIQAHQAYIDLAQRQIDKARQAISLISSRDVLMQFRIQEIEGFILHAERQIDQIRRRVVDGETIPHHEKVFSLFEEHTEWISKGKAGVPVELGLKVCIVKYLASAKFWSSIHFKSRQSVRICMIKDEFL